MPKRNRSERQKYLNAAEQVLALINKSAAPDSLTEAMMIALQQAATLNKVNLWKTDDWTNDGMEEMQADALAELFATSKALSLQDKKDAARGRSRTRGGNSCRRRDTAIFARRSGGCDRNDVKRD